MNDERIIGGVSCRQVLADLSAYLDGELAAEARARIETHVRGCELCERFGGVFGATLRALRSRLLEPMPDAVADRLDEALRRAR